MTNPGSRLVVLAVSAATFAAFLGCASTPGELDLPPQTLTEAPTSTTEEEAALVATERPAPAAETEAAAAVAPSEGVGDGALVGRAKGALILDFRQCVVAHGTAVAAIFRRRGKIAAELQSFSEALERAVKAHW